MEHVSNLQGYQRATDDCTDGYLHVQTMKNKTCHEKIVSRIIHQPFEFDDKSFISNHWMVDGYQALLMQPPLGKH